jgi:hypothetical protein
MRLIIERGIKKLSTLAFICVVLLITDENNECPAGLTGK